MVYTAAQQTAFFTSAAQMGLSDRTRDQLDIEGITDVAYLSEWTDDQWDDFATNCRMPSQIPDPANAANLIHQQPFVVPVRSLKRLKIASKMVRYYEQTDRALSAANMQWTTVILNFDMQDMALKEAIKKDSPAIPKLRKNGTVTKWAPSFVIAISQHYVTRKASIDYLLRDDPVVPAAAPPLAPGMPHSVEGGSIQADMKARLTHAHALFQMDNDMLFLLLDEAV